MVGERDTPMGRSLYLARPIRASGECAECHGSPAAAPASMVARYGRDNGFGWQDREIVGAQVVSVPFASATANAQRAFRAFLTALAAVFAAIFIALNALLYGLLVRPVRRIAHTAERVSMGDMAAPEFPRSRAGGNSVVGALVQQDAHQSRQGDAASRALTRRCLTVPA